MPTDMTQHSGESNSTDAPPASKAGVSAVRDTKAGLTHLDSGPVQPERHKAKRRRRLLIGVLVGHGR